MAHLSSNLISKFREARGNLVTLIDQQAVFLRLDINSRNYVIPCLRGQIPQYLDIVETISKKMAVDSRHHPYVLVHQKDFYSVTVPMHCAALKGQCAHLANRLRDNNCTDIPIAVAKQLDDLIANLPF
ncbi:uncharacterized protein N7529_008434 [Penicillium soppii]|jgi:ethanolamine utilization protein EutA (predicted chaperonin)|uniref:uncharacterized protein n=1 Tax=Penicillium soppii TaxID=69789 RepID=UPI0025467ACE|nr:uncharacterized protein N7529_008434 [Penicillium soppii]KAJ5861124.1 hypothetical protein N7529_008434 [Penicillium soppii]